MKPMSDKKMGMGKGGVDSDGYFPSEAQHKKLPRAGEIHCPKYPDTEEEIHRDQEQFVKEANKGKAKPEFRH
jgi:hypothetical protein